MNLVLHQSWRQCVAKFGTTDYSRCIWLSRSEKFGECGAVLTAAGSTTLISQETAPWPNYLEKLSLCPFVLNLVTVYRWPICGQKVRGEFGEQQSVLLRQLTSMCFRCLSTMIDWLNQSNRLSCLRHCQSNKKIYLQNDEGQRCFFALPPPV